MVVPTQLPLCDGPKLHRFRHHDSRIEWLERLGNHQSDESSADGYVFRAKINNNEYAIKVVSNLHSTSPRSVEKNKTCK